jgi:hypothetical protein
VSELLRILAVTVGATPADINPSGWRAFVARRQADRGA